MSRAKDQARADWVCTHLELVHEIYELAAEGDKIAQGLKADIWEKCFLTPPQISFARTYVRDVTGKVLEVV